MNPAIAMLTHEHEVIMKVVNALGTMSNELAHGRPVDANILREAVRFMRSSPRNVTMPRKRTSGFPRRRKTEHPQTACPASGAPGRTRRRAER